MEAHTFHLIVAVYAKAVEGVLQALDRKTETLQEEVLQKSTLSLAMLYEDGALPRPFSARTLRSR